MTVAITDINQFTELRARADRNDPEVIREVAGQFEALFMQMMLKNMRAASVGDSLMGDSKQQEMYREMMDQQLSLEMSQGKGIGLADMLVRQLGGSPISDAQQQMTNFRVPTERVSMVAPVASPIVNGVTEPSKVLADNQSKEAKTADMLPFPTTSVPSVEKTEDSKVAWKDPESFAKAIWPHVRRAASALQVSPVAVLAQTALETGWGAKVMDGKDGMSSLNLFGIKAGKSWDGQSVAKRTVEFDGNVARAETASFRAYDDLRSTFDDYAQFLQGTRYASVSGQGDDVAGFAKALQKSGYATDPNYATKIQAISQGPTMQKALRAVGDITAL